MLSVFLAKFIPLWINLTLFCCFLIPERHPEHNFKHQKCKHYLHQRVGNRLKSWLWNLSSLNLVTLNLIRCKLCVALTNVSTRRQVGSYLRRNFWPDLNQCARSFISCLYTSQVDLKESWGLLDVLQSVMFKHNLISMEQMIPSFHLVCYNCCGQMLKSASHLTR